MALILVVVIAALLAAIALPFAFSMGQQEKGVRGVTDRVHARYAAAAARNRAVAAAVPGWEGLEELPHSHVPFNTPFHDTAEEFSSGRAGRPLAPGVDTGALVADEQGKLNVRTAPQLCVDNLMKRIDARVDDPRDYLTESSGRPAAWIEPQTIRWAEPWIRNNDYILFSVDRFNHLSPGTRVRVSGPKVVQVVEVVEVEEGLLALKEAKASAAVDSLIEIELRHALNINTAGREALAAAFEGLALRSYLDKDRVTRDEATLLAAAMVKQTFEEWKDFWKFLGDQVQRQVISDVDYAAIRINAEWPTDWSLAGTGTVPLTLQSWNYVTVAARGLMERPNRAVGGECDLREIVEVAPPGTIRWRCRSQQDFRDVLERQMANGIFTGPMFDTEKAIRERDRGAWLTGVTGEDNRAQWPVSMHFGPHNEGKMLGDGIQFGGLPPFATGQIVCWPSGATELWFLAPDKDATIFEAGEEEWSNRILLTYEGNGTAKGPYLRLLVKDATLEKGFSEVVHHVGLVAKRWYHVGAFWKSTRNGGMTMTLDGMPVGEWRAVPEGPAQQKNKELGVPVHLAGGLGKTDTMVECDVDVSDFPSPGQIAIGQEVIEYQAANGNSFAGCRRGARGSRPWQHPAGATVALWGYSDAVLDGRIDYRTAGFDVPLLTWNKIPETAGTLTYPVPTTAECATWVVVQTPPDPPKVGMFTGDAILEVPHGSADPFPDKGWLFISRSEIVHYEAHDSNQFTGLQRGLFGTTAADHLMADSVELIGFHVTSNAGYPEPTVLCIGNEFFGPMQKAGTDGWVALVGKNGAGVAPWPLFRGSEWGAQSSDQSHPAGAPVLPTFPLDDAKAGRGDRVTIVQKDYEKREEAVVACSAWLEGWKPNVDPPALRSVATTIEYPFLLAAIDRPVQWEVPGDDRFMVRRWSRLLKFPSGELPFSPPASFRVGLSSQETAPGELGGWVDELRCSTAEYEHWCLAKPIDAMATELTFGIKLPDDPCGEPPPPPKPAPFVPGPGTPVPPPTDPPPPREPPISYTPIDTLGGAILVDDEVIGYVEYDPATRKLKGLKRGYLGTTPRAHAKCSLAFPLTYLAIATLKKSVDSTSRIFEVEGAGGFVGEGYFLVDSEMVGWSRTATDQLKFPAGCAFRGAFGTTPDAHPEDSLLYSMPWRYWDRYTRAADDTDLHWFEATLRATSARWKAIRWEELFGGASVNVHVFVRFNTSPRWIHMPFDLKKTKNETVQQFYEFDGPNGGKLGDTLADQLDVRVMFEFVDGAYAKGEWKECPLVKGFEVEYEQPNVVHRHEEK